MKIAIVGSKGIPAKHGGYETFAEKVSYLFKIKHDVLVVGDNSNFYSKNHINGIHIINSSFSKSKNPILFYHDSLKIAYNWGANLSIMCGIGGVFSTQFFASSKMRIFVNPDGLGFNRDKWVWWKKIGLISQFIYASLFSDYIICDSIGIKNFFQKKLYRKKNIFVVEYGTDLNNQKNISKLDSEKYFKELKLTKYNYYLVVSRLEPENNVMKIISGYKMTNQNIPLVIVGNINTEYAKSLIIESTKNIFFTDGIYDSEKLSLLRFYCKAYFHGHSVGGTNPSLLEAMGSRNLIIAHDNIFNREVLNNNGYFFSTVNDIFKIIQLLESGNEQKKIANFQEKSFIRAKNYYSWNLIAQKYLDIFKFISNESN